MRPGAVHDEDGVAWQWRKCLCRNPRVRQVDRSENMACREEFLATHIQEDEVSDVVFNRVVDVRAVRFKRESCLQMSKCGFRGSCGEMNNLRFGLHIVVLVEALARWHFIRLAF